MLAGYVLGLALLVPCAASAQALEPAVEALLREGIAHRVAGRDELAIARFEAAYAMRRAPITAGQLALACQSVGRWVDADRYMREALAVPDDDWVRRRRRELDEAYAVVRRNVGELELRGGPDGATVRVDGVDAGTLPLAAPLRLRAGVVTVDVRAAEYLPLTRQVTVLGGELTREPLQMTPAPPPAPEVVPQVPTAPVAVVPAVEPPVEPPVVPPREASRSPVLGRVLGGAGLVLVVGGAVALGLREASAARFNGSCPTLDTLPRESQSPTCQAELATGDWTLPASVVGFVGGAALVGVGALLMFLPRRSASSRAAWGCAPTVNGALCAVRF